MHAVKQGLRLHGGHYHIEAKTRVSVLALYLLSMADVAAVNVPTAWDVIGCWEVSQKLESMLKDWQTSR